MGYNVVEDGRGANMIACDLVCNDLEESFLSADT